jgi:hypothetical protein
VLRREIELLTNPPVLPEAEETMQVTEPEPEVEQVKAEDIDGVEETKMEEEKEEDVSDDGLFTSEFDHLMDPSGFQSELGFGESMDWMNDV